MLQRLIIDFNHSIILETTSMGYTYGQEKGLCAYDNVHLLKLQMCTTQYSESDDGEEVWNESQEEVDGDLEPPSVEAYESASSTNGQESILARWIVAFIGYLHAFYALSDGVAELVLKFFVILFGVLGQFSTLCFAIAQLLPKSLYKLCLSCRYMLYAEDASTMEKCVDRNQTSKTCPYVRFPRHPHARMRQPCNTLLLKTVELASGKKILYPYLVYCYMSIEDSLQALLLEPSFVKKCDEWKRNVGEPGVMNDIFDVRIWRDFQSYEGTPFLSGPFTFGLADWFQPFKHSQYSVGAIYMSILNLSRSLRYKPENVMLVGILPGPSEPRNVNSFLEPLVEELTEFFDGKELRVHGVHSTAKVRCALLCAACDLPAGRKLCGFLSYTATYGCSRCLVQFPGEVGNKDCSGFNRDSWPKRSVAQHRVVASEIRECNTMTSVAEKESSSGYRYTKLLDLPYFSPTRMLVVDPMHNLYLGTGNHMLKRYLDRSGHDIGVKVGDDSRLN